MIITNRWFYESITCKSTREVRWSAKTSGALHPPIYLAYAASVLKKDHNVKLMDCVAMELEKKDFYNRVKKYKPDFLVMDTSTPSIINDIDIAKKIKEITNTKIILVGPHVSALPQQTFEMGQWIDYIAMGEYDYTLPELIKKSGKNKSLKNVKGISYQSNGKIVVTKRREPIQNLDELPWPDRNQLPIDKYKDTLLTDPFTFIVTARGCPCLCNYCLWPQVMFYRKLRTRNPTDVVDEVEHCISKYNLKSYKFFDDTFTIDKKRVKQICEDIIDRGIDKPWICNARVNNLDKETMKIMKKAGCNLFKIGVETGTQKLLNVIKKGTTIQQIEKFFKLTKEVGIKTFGSFMVGLPGETKQTIRNTINLAKKIEPDMAQFIILSPLPGTEMFDYMTKNRWISFPIDWSDYVTEEGFVNIVFKHPNFPEDELRDICGQMWKEFYLRPKFIFNRIKKSLTDFNEFKRSVTGVRKVFRY